MKDKTSIGERVKRYRQQQGLTQAELASNAGISRVALGNYERGDRIPTIDIFANIADALHISTDELIGRQLTHHDEVERLKNLYSVCGYTIRSLQSHSDCGDTKSTSFSVSFPDGREICVNGFDALQDIYNTAQNNALTNDIINSIKQIALKESLLEYNHQQKIKEEREEIEQLTHEMLFKEETETH